MRLALLLPLSACGLLGEDRAPAPPQSVLVYPDADGDGFGDAAHEGEWIEWDDAVPTGFVRDARDCDDTVASVSPGNGCECTGAARIGMDDWVSATNAIEAGTYGQIVYICPGVHEVDARIGEDSLRVESWSEDPLDTQLTGADAHRVLRHGGAFLEIVGLTLSNGYHHYDGGAVVATGRLTVLDSVFRDNVADYEGGAIAYSSGRDHGGLVTVERSTFENNGSGYEGGALSVGYRHDTELVVSDSIFRGNVADYEGGAVSVSSDDDHFARAAFEGVVFEDNRSNYEGGAVEIGSWGDGSLLVQDCTFHRNSAGSGGGGAVNTRSWGHIDVLSVDTDWGTGADDNSPSDLDENGSLGTSESFGCSSTEHDSSC